MCDVTRVGDRCAFQGHLEVGEGSINVIFSTSIGRVKVRLRDANLQLCLQLKDVYMYTTYACVHTTPKFDFRAKKSDIVSEEA